MLLQVQKIRKLKKFLGKIKYPSNNHLFSFQDTTCHQEQADDDDTLDEVPKVSQRRRVGVSAEVSFFDIFVFKNVFFHRFGPMHKR